MKARPTIEEMVAEWKYRFDERIGILLNGEQRQCTNHEIYLAVKEADEAVEKMAGTSLKNDWARIILSL